MPRPVQPKTIMEHIETLNRMARQVDADKTLARQKKLKLIAVLQTAVRAFATAQSR